MICSNSQSTWSFRHAHLIFGLLLVSLGIFLFIAPQKLSTGDYEYYTTSLFEVILAICIGSLLILTRMLYPGRVVNVCLNQQKIIIENKEYIWTEIDSLKRVLFVSPPVYKLSIRETQEVFIFPTDMTRGRFIEIEFPFINIIWDRSIMGKAIRIIKKKYAI